MKPGSSTASVCAVLLTLLLAAGGVGLLPGCGGGPHSPPAADPLLSGAGGCLIVPGRPVRFEPITVVLGALPDPSHAPVPRGDGETLVFRHLYESLVTVTCDGEVEPGLASGWKRREGGRVWEFTLRPGARFSDGSHLDAESVRTAWLDLRRRSHPAVAPWLWLDPDSIRTMEDRLVVPLSQPLGDRPLLFASPSLAVHRPASSGWPAGSGPYLMIANGVPAGGSGDGFTLSPNPYHPAPGRGRAALSILVREDADPRDRLAGEGEVVPVGSRAAVDYARSLPGCTVHPLPASRTYFLITPELARAAAAPGSASDADPVRRELARDVMVTDAGPAVPADCEGLRRARRDPGKPLPRLISDPLDRKRSPPRIVYPEDDPDAGRLAGRLVSLAAGRSPSAPGGTPPGFPVPVSLDPGIFPVAAAVSGESLPAALVAGRDWAYVVSRSRGYPDPCLDRMALEAGLGWLPEDGGAGPAVTALVESRQHLVVRTAVAGIRADWDGTPRLEGAGRLGDPEP